MNQEIIKSIIDINSSITFNEDSEVFILAEIDKWVKSLSDANENLETLSDFDDYGVNND